MSFAGCAGSPAGADAEIEAAVIGLVAVDVVHDHALRRLHDLAVHEDGLALLFAGGVAVLQTTCTG